MKQFIPSHQVLWQAFCAGNQTAFGQFYNNLYDSCAVIAYRYVKDTDAACDVASSVFEKLLAMKENGSGAEIDYIESYLRRMVVSRALNWLRDNGREIPTSLLSNSHDEDNRESIDNTLQQLNTIHQQYDNEVQYQDLMQQCRQIVETRYKPYYWQAWLFHLEGYSDKEAALLLKPPTTTGNFGVMLSCIRKVLREKLCQYR